MFFVLFFGFVAMRDAGVDLRFIAEQDFYEPVAIKVDRRDRIFVVDLKDNQVVVFDAEGQRLQTIGGPGQGPGEFNNPGDIDFLPDGRLLVADCGQRRLHLFDADGKFLKVIKILDQPVGKLLVLPDGSVAINRSNGVSFSFEIGEEVQKRFGVFDLEGKLLRRFGSMEQADNPLLQIILNSGPIGRWQDKLVMACQVKPLLYFYEGESESQARYPLKFEPREPKSSMKESKAADGSISFQMSVETDWTCHAMAVLSGEAILLIRGVTNEGEGKVGELVLVNWNGDLQKTWPGTFEANGLAVSRDGKYAYIINEADEEQVVSRVRL